MSVLLRVISEIQSSKFFVICKESSGHVFVLILNVENKNQGLDKMNVANAKNSLYSSKRRSSSGSKNWLENFNCFIKPVFLNKIIARPYLCYKRFGSSVSCD